MLLVYSYNFGYLTELHSDNIAMAMFWINFEYISIPLLNSTWLIISFQYLGIIKKINSPVTYFAFIVPILTIIVRFTNDLHSLYYSDPYLIKFDTFIWSNQLMEFGITLMLDIRFS